MISDFRREVAENCSVLDYYVASSGNLLPTFGDNISVPFSGFKNSCTLRMGTIVCPEKSVRNYHYWLRNNSEESSSLGRSSSVSAAGGRWFLVPPKFVVGLFGFNSLVLTECSILDPCYEIWNNFVDNYNGPGVSYRVSQPIGHTPVHGDALYQ